MSFRKSLKYFGCVLLGLSGVACFVTFMASFPGAFDYWQSQYELSPGSLYVRLAPTTQFIATVTVSVLAIAYGANKLGKLRSIK